MRAVRKTNRIICITILGLMLAFGMLLSVCHSMDRLKEEDVVLENPGIKVTFFDVGKGDAILIETENHNMLIDTGYDRTSGVILDYLEKENVQKLDYLILTHFDKDHVGGADQILKQVKAGEILQPDYESDGGQYLEYREIVEEMVLQPNVVTEAMRFSLDGAEFLIYPPEQKEYEEEDNDFSLVVSVKYGKRSFLFAGDCERERLDELLQQEEFDLVHDVLKVPHHGKDEKNSEAFLKAVSPKAAVITCSEEEPDREKICEMLNELGTEIYLTADGTVTCLCDGDTIQIMQEQ
ncbi:MAG: MBL fold metallo-hydrolase [Lachnospiraceae bacterium]|nr:MBL fold metallo-hydrolase [Lachnospiraceae bacterium]